MLRNSEQKQDPGHSPWQPSPNPRLQGGGPCLPGEQGKKVEGHQRVNEMSEEEERCVCVGGRWCRMGRKPVSSRFLC